MCNYKLKDGEKCKEEALKGSKYCILHIPYPEDRYSEEFERIAKLKEKKVKEKISKGNFNFEGAKLLKADFSNLKIKGDVNFMNTVILEDIIFDKATIGGYALFNKATIEGYASFIEATIKGDASFGKATIEEDAWFTKATIEGDAWFTKATIGWGAWFDKATIGGNALFGGATIGGDAWFDKATIGGNALFGEATIKGDASFDKVTIEGDAWFTPLDIKGKLSFKGTGFKKLESEKESCRAAVKVLERIGDREGADYHFYREMVARRKQKKWIIRILEWLLADATCQYGTNFFKPLWIWIISVLIVFPLIYYFGNGIVSPSPLFPFFKGAAESVKSFASAEYFSIVTATTLGYGDLRPALTTIIYHIPIFRVLAGLEAIFGTFMWVIFLTVFARKYMR